MSPPHAKNNTLNSRPRQPTLHIPLSLYPTLFLVRISRVVTRTRWEYHLLLLINQRKPSRQPTPNMNTEKYVLVRKNNPVKRIHDPIHEKEAKNTVSNKGGRGVIPSTHGKAAFQRKQREKRPSSIPFMSKGVHMQRKNTAPGHADNP